MFYITDCKIQICPIPEVTQKEGVHQVEVGFQTDLEVTPERGMVIVPESAEQRCMPALPEF